MKKQIPLTGTRIERRFATLAEKKEKGFIAYISAGDPTLEETADQVLRLEDAGVDIVELGVPFSDPLADGPVNQEAAARALAGGATLPRIFAMVRALRTRTQMPLMCYCYMNLLYAPGFERTVGQSARAGLDGMLILDLPTEEAGPYAAILEKNKMNNIVLITPTSPDERIQSIVGTATGFIYAVSRMGVTGIQKKMGHEAGSLVKRARQFTDLPVALGFGISAPAQAAEMAEFADAVVVGSAIVDRFHKAGKSLSKKKETTQWIAEMVRAAKGK